MGRANQFSVDFAGCRMKSLEAIAYRPYVAPTESLQVDVPDLRWLGQLICVATSVFTGWAIWTMGSLVSSYL